MDYVIESNGYDLKEGDYEFGIKPNYYNCIILLEALSESEFKTIEIVGDYFPNGGFISSYHNLEFIADINNDEKLEFFIHSRYYEGMSYIVYEIINEKANYMLRMGRGV